MSPVQFKEKVAKTRKGPYTIQAVIRSVSN